MIATRKTRGRSSGDARLHRVGGRARQEGAARRQRRASVGRHRRAAGHQRHRRHAPHLGRAWRICFRRYAREPLRCWQRDGQRASDMAGEGAAAWWWWSRQGARFPAVREVDRCAGGLRSPKLLMLSGIGPADHLKQVGIAVVKDAPQVGGNLHDHMLVRLVLRPKGPMAPPVDTGMPASPITRSNCIAAGPEYPDFRPLKRAERARPAVRSRLPDHARA